MCEQTYNNLYVRIFTLAKSERERQIPCDISYMWDVKYDTNELIYKTETDAQTQRADLWLPSGGQWGRDGLGVWDQQMQTSTYRMDKQQGPTVQHRELY